MLQGTWLTTRAMLRVDARREACVRVAQRLRSGLAGVVAGTGVVGLVKQGSLFPQHVNPDKAPSLLANRGIVLLCFILTGSRGTGAEAAKHNCDKPQHWPGHLTTEVHTSRKSPAMLWSLSTPRIEPTWPHKAPRGCPNLCHSTSLANSLNIFGHWPSRMTQHNPNLCPTRAFT